MPLVRGNQGAKAEDVARRSDFAAGRLLRGHVRRGANGGCRVGVRDRHRPRSVGLHAAGAATPGRPADKGATGVSAGIKARLDRLQEKNRADGQLDGYSRYQDLRSIHSAPEFARRLARLAAEAADEGVEPATWALAAWPAGATAADMEAVRTGRLVPSTQLLDAYLVSLGVSPAHLKYWHRPLRRVYAATAEVINLRTRAIQLEHDLEREWNAVRRRRSRNPLRRSAACRAERRDRRTGPAALACRSLKAALARGGPGTTPQR
jgi:hypothetical protein